MKSSSAFRESSDLRRFVADLIARWQAGEPADSAPRLAALPELARHPSLQLDLAYEAYCQESDAGRPPELDEFCRRFPAVQRDLRRLLMLHRRLAPDLSAGLRELSWGTLSQPADRRPSDDPACDWPAPGDRRFGFDLEAEIGRGAGARVYRARQADVGGRLVALKVAPSAGFEAAIAGRFDHPHIVPILARHAEPGPLAAVSMPWQGELTLERLIADLFSRDAPPRFAADYRSAALAASTTSPAPPLDLPCDVPYDEAAALCTRRLADALDLVHRHGLLHGDLKPANVLILPDGAPQLLDFHLASSLHGSRCRPSGTIPYMAPELLAAVFAPPDRPALRPDPRTDVYSLAALLAELLLGELPASLDPRPAAPSDTVLALAAEPLRDLDPALRRLLLDGLDPDPARRLPAAAALRDRLDDFLAARRRRRSTRRRNGRRRTIALLGTLLLAVGGAAASRPMWETAESSEAALREGAEAFRRGDWLGAERAFQRAWESSATATPGERLARLARACVRRRRALRSGDPLDWLAALADFEACADALAEAPFASSPSAAPAILAAVAECLHRNGRSAAAIEAYEAARRQGDRSVALRCNLAYALRQQSRDDEALLVLDRLLEAEPECGPAYWSRAAVRTRLERQAWRASNAVRHSNSPIVRHRPLDDPRIAADLRQAARYGVDPRRLKEFAELADSVHIRSTSPAPPASAASAAELQGPNRRVAEEQVEPSGGRSRPEPAAPTAFPRFSAFDPELLELPDPWPVCERLDPALASPSPIGELSADERR